MSEFYLDKDKLGVVRLFEKDGDFKDESDADLLIATIHDESYGILLVSMLNDRFG